MPVEMSSYFTLKEVICDQSHFRVSVPNCQQGQCDLDQFMILLVSPEHNAEFLCPANTFKVHGRNCEKKFKCLSPQKLTVYSYLIVQFSGSTHPMNSYHPGLILKSGMKAVGDTSPTEDLRQTVPNKNYPPFFFDTPEGCYLFPCHSR